MHYTNICDTRELNSNCVLCVMGGAENFTHTRKFARILDLLIALLFIEFIVFCILEALL